MKFGQPLRGLVPTGSRFEIVLESLITRCCVNFTPLRSLIILLSREKAHQSVSMTRSILGLTLFRVLIIGLSERKAQKRFDDTIDYKCSPKLDHSHRQQRSPCYVDHQRKLIF